MFRTNPRKQQGFTFIEAMIAFIVLVVGLVGVMALQANAKRASFDSMQRAAALALGNDIIQRMHANDIGVQNNRYNNLTITSKQALVTTANCINTVCTEESMAAFDINEWRKAIRAQDRTGGLSDATICVATNEPNPDGIDIQVVITWRGREALKATAENKDISCGTADDKRRLLALNSFLYVRDI